MLFNNCVNIQIQLKVLTLQVTGFSFFLQHLHVQIRKNVALNTGTYNE